MKLNVRVVAAAAAVLGVAALVLPASVGAQKVQNPGTFALQATGGQMVIGGLSLDLTPNPLPQCSDGVDNNSNGLIDLADGGCAAGPNGEPASSDDSELVGGFQPKVNVSITGTIDGAGNINIPTSGVVFPPAYVAINVNGVWVVRADVLATEPATGTLDPLTGAAVLNVKARIKLSGNVGNQLPSTCSIGTVGSPVTLNLITGRKEAVPGGNGAITGAPYNSVTGTALLVDNAFSVPGATGCALNPPFNFPDYGPTINQQVGIPSAAGRNAAVVAGKTAPVLTKAINPVITSNVPLAGNEAPFDVSLSGASSTLAKGPATYSWEFSDGTTATGAYVDKTFNAGNQSAKLTVTDADGDKNSVTSNFVVAPGTGSTTTTTTTASTTTTTTPTTTTTTTPTTTTTSTTTTTPTTTTTTTTPTTTTTSTTTTTTPTTTTTTTTPTTTTTSTTIPQPSDDSVQVRVNGAVNYVNGGTGNGDLSVQRDSSGIRSVTGFLDIPGTQGGDARASVSIQRAWILPLWTGQVSMRDQAAGVNVSAPVFGQISRGPSASSAKGTSNWFIAGTFPNLFRPYSFSWEVIDAD